ncbi:hypothetical protein F2P56_014463, partial [Juglans regia]
MLLIYVDDIILTGSSPSSMAALVHTLSVDFHMKDLGNLHYFLGVQVTRTSEDLFLHQSRYLLSLLQRFGLDGVKPVSTPLASGQKFSAQEGILLENPTSYRQMVGTLQYLTLTRPDVAFAVNFVCQFMQAPREPHLQAVKRIFRYLKGTIHLGLHFIKSPLSAFQGYCDADWAGSRDDRRSTSGFAIYMGSNLLSWGAKKQTTVARSTAEAEYRSLASTTAELLWFMNLLTNLGYKLSAPTIHSDNISAISMAR